MTKIKKVKYICIAVLALLISGLVCFSIVQSRKYSLNINENYSLAKAVVQNIDFDDTDKLYGEEYVRQAKQEFEIKILDGSHKGERYKIRHSIEKIDMHKRHVSVGDKIIVNCTMDENDNISSIALYEICRENYLYALIGIFILSVILICGKKGIKSVVSLLFTAVMILKVLIPLIISGVNPLVATIFVCFVTVASAIILLNGINKKSAISIIGTFGGIIIATICAIIVGNLCKITGMADTESQIIAYTNSHLGLDFKSIMFAAIVIGSLGAVMDVSVSIVSAMEEMIAVNDKIKRKEFIKSGMNLGKDIIGAMSNTLILAYAGGAFNFILLFAAQKMSYSTIINMEIITTEVITAFAGSLGIVWTVPITVFAMAYLYYRRNK